VNSAWNASCTAKDAGWDAVWETARDTVIANYDLTGQYAYIATERFMLIRLPELIEKCRAILTKKIPNYRQIVPKLVIPPDILFTISSTFCLPLLSKQYCKILIH